MPKGIFFCLTSTSDSPNWAKVYYLGCNEKPVVALKSVCLISNISINSLSGHVLITEHHDYSMADIKPSCQNMYDNLF